MAQSTSKGTISVAVNAPGRLPPKTAPVGGSGRPMPDWAEPSIRKRLGCVVLYSGE